MVNIVARLLGLDEPKEQKKPEPEEKKKPNPVHKEEARGEDESE